MTRARPNPDAPAIGSAHVHVDAPITTVWSVLSDLEAWPRWNRGVSRIRVKGPFAVGTSFVWVAGGSIIASRLEEIDEPGRLVWSGKTFGIRAVHEWTLKTHDQGTSVYTEESFDGIVARLFPGAMQKALTRALSQGVAALKAEAESQHRHA